MHKVEHSPEYDELKESFRHFDKDHNGFIDRREFAELMRAMGGGMSAEELEVGWRSIDGNHNGKIEFKEFYAWWMAR